MGAGLLFWTLLEYALHRFAFHGFAPHYQHHADPKDPKYIAAPLWFSLPVAMGLFLAVLALNSWQVASAVATGVLTGYLLYEWVHHRIHRGKRQGWLMHHWRKQHYYHHFRDTEACYGVTTPLWDVVLGTKRPAGPATASRS
jgi:sterol desaturase/sphingolipid hydroxylase (fatty acid hydroxylase superfamily)